MLEKKKQKTIRFNPSQMEKVKSFMEYTRDPQVDAIAGKNTMAGSISKAIWYLFNSFFDKRSFIIRGLFDRSLFILKDNAKAMNEAGIKLNQMVHAYHSGQPPRLKRLDILDELDRLVTENTRQLEQFKTSYTIEK